MELLEKRGPGRPRLEVTRYSAAHKRLTTDKGKASEQPCVDCGGRAREWSLSHDAQTIHYQWTHGGRYLTAYSMNPADYDARCAKCHRAYDRGESLVSV